MNNFDLKNKVAIVTGGAQGFGFAITEKFLASGAKVLIWDIDEKEANDALKKLNNENCSYQKVDVNNFNDIEKTLKQIESSHGKIDIFINNAGIIGDSNQHFKGVSSNSWLEVLKINLIAPLLITQSIIRNIEISNDKKIYFISSKVGSIDDNRGGGMYIYRSSKTALNQVVKSLSIDLKPLGISVISLHPGWVRTDMGGPNALISVDESINGMMSVISNTNIKNSGQFLNYDGSEIPW